MHMADRMLRTGLGSLTALELLNVTQNKCASFVHGLAVVDF